jgi:hypothetical protein
MATNPSAKAAKATITIALTQEEANAIATALFMCLRPNNFHPPFEPVVNIEVIEAGYRKVASLVGELEGRSCARCGRAWEATMPPWDLIGDPETGELDTVCPDCSTPQERAAWDEHQRRFAEYAKKLYSTPSWKGGPSGTSHQQT